MGAGSGGRYYSEAGGFPVQDLPGLQIRYKDSLGNIVRPYLKVKNKRRTRDEVLVLLEFH